MNHITNATIINITAPGTPEPSGKILFGDGTNTDLRCFVERPRMSQVNALAQRNVLATQIMYIWKPKPAGIDLSVGYRVSIRVDGSGLGVFELQTFDDHEKAGGLSHFECALKGVR